MTTASAYGWVVAHGLFTSLVWWFVGAVMGGLFVPLLKRAARPARSELAKIADLLDTNTDGGLRDVRTAIEGIEVTLKETAREHS